MSSHRWIQFASLAAFLVAMCGNTGASASTAGDTKGGHLEEARLQELVATLATALDEEASMSQDRGIFRERAEAQELLRHPLKVSLFATDRLQELVELGDASPNKEFEVLVFLTEQTGFAGAVPVLMQWAQAAKADRPQTQIAAQALIRLIDSETEDAPRTWRTQDEVDTLVEHSRLWAVHRVTADLQRLEQEDDGVGGEWIYASDPVVLRQRFAKSWRIHALSYLISLAPESLRSRFGQGSREFSRDFALSALAYAVEQGQCRAALPFLIDFLNRGGDDLSFAPSFAASALIVMTGQHDPNPKNRAYSSEQIETVLHRARKTLNEILPRLSDPNKEDSQ